MSVFDFTEMSLTEAQALYENAEGVSPARRAAMKAELEAVTADWTARATAETQRLKADEQERRASLEVAWTEAANEAKAVRTSMALGDLSIDDGRKRIHALMRREQELARQGEALQEVFALRQTLESDPIGYRENLMRKYSLPKPRWTAFL